MLWVKRTSDYWNMTSAMALPHAISYNSIFNSPSSTGSSGGNTASKSSEKNLYTKFIKIELEF